MISVTLFIFALIAASFNIILARKPRTGKMILEVFILYILLFNVGLGGLLAFYGHAFMSKEVAASIGWVTSPFQFEIAIANLGMGVLGLLCFFIRRDFWLATSLYGLVFGWGAGYGHIREIIIYQNYAPNNAGLILWFGDLTLPLLLLILVLINRRLSAGS